MSSNTPTLYYFPYYERERIPRNERQFCFKEIDTDLAVVALKNRKKYIRDSLKEISHQIAMFLDHGSRVKFVSKVCQ